MLFNEPKLLKYVYGAGVRRRRESFSALQRAEIAEMHNYDYDTDSADVVSVLFNEPKLLKFERMIVAPIYDEARFSALQRAEIAEIR